LKELQTGQRGIPVPPTRSLQKPRTEELGKRSKEELPNRPTKETGDRFQFRAAKHKVDPIDRKQGNDVNNLLRRATEIASIFPGFPICAKKTPFHGPAMTKIFPLAAKPDIRADRGPAISRQTSPRSIFNASAQEVLATLARQGIRSQKRGQPVVCAQGSFPIGTMENTIEGVVNNFFRHNRPLKNVQKTNGTASHELKEIKKGFDKGPLRCGKQAEKRLGEKPAKPRKKKTKVDNPRSAHA